jgi:hypothetical protein
MYLTNQWLQVRMRSLLSHSADVAAQKRSLWFPRFQAVRKSGWKSFVYRCTHLLPYGSILPSALEMRYLVRHWLLPFLLATSSSFVAG